jgi:putative membrane protein
MRPFMYQPGMHQYFWLGAITRLAVLVVIVVGIVMLARYLTHRYPAGSVPGTGARPQQSTAIQILEERFARGEIDDEEFRRRKQALLS